MNDEHDFASCYSKEWVEKDANTDSELNIFRYGDVLILYKHYYVYNSMYDRDMKSLFSYIKGSSILSILTTYSHYTPYATTLFFTDGETELELSATRNNVQSSVRGIDPILIGFLAREDGALKYFHLRIDDFVKILGQQRQNAFEEEFLKKLAVSRELVKKEKAEKEAAEAKKKAEAERQRLEEVKKKQSAASKLSSALDNL